VVVRTPWTDYRQVLVSVPAHDKSKTGNVNVTLRCIRQPFLQCESNNCHIFWVCVCSLIKL